VFLLLSLPFVGQATVRPDSDNSTAQLFSSFAHVDGQEINSASFRQLLSKLEQKKASLKTEKDFLQYAFSKTHQQFLKRFVQYASFNDVISKGQYNCLTATILYSLILHHFNIDFEVIETNYHIFILAQTSQGRILLETTDRLYGFVDTPEEIETRIKGYKQNALQSINTKASYYKFSFELYNSVSIDELRGLLYFNKAVNAYNHNKLTAAIQNLIYATEFYISSRTDEFSQILILSLRESSVDDQLKDQYLRSIFAMRQKNPVVAMLN
jgi:hypothetical protein